MSGGSAGVRPGASGQTCDLSDLRHCELPEGQQVVIDLAQVLDTTGEDGREANQSPPPIVARAVIASAAPTVPRSQLYAAALQVYRRLYRLRDDRDPRLQEFLKNFSPFADSLARTDRNLKNPSPEETERLEDDVALLERYRDFIREGRRILGEIPHEVEKDPTYRQLAKTDPAWAFQFQDTLEFLRAEVFGPNTILWGEWNRPTSTLLPVPTTYGELEQHTASLASATLAADFDRLLRPLLEIEQTKIEQSPEFQARKKIFESAHRLQAFGRLMRFANDADATTRLEPEDWRQLFVAVRGDLMRLEGELKKILPPDQFAQPFSEFNLVYREINPLVDSDAPLEDAEKLAEALAYASDVAANAEARLLATALKKEANGLRELGGSPEIPFFLKRADSIIRLVQDGRLGQMEQVVERVSGLVAALDREALRLSIENELQFFTSHEEAVRKGYRDRTFLGLDALPPRYFEAGLAILQEADRFLKAGRVDEARQLFSDFAKSPFHQDLIQHLEAAGSWEVAKKFSLGVALVVVAGFTAGAAGTAAAPLFAGLGGTGKVVGTYLVTGVTFGAVHTAGSLALGLTELPGGVADNIGVVGWELLTATLMFPALKASERIVVNSLKVALPTMGREGVLLAKIVGEYGGFTGFEWAELNAQLALDGKFAPGAVTHHVLSWEACLHRAFFLGALKLGTHLASPMVNPAMQRLQLRASRQVLERLALFNERRQKILDALSLVDLSEETNGLSNAQWLEPTFKGLVRLQRQRIALLRSLGVPREALKGEEQALRNAEQFYRRVKSLPDNRPRNTGWAGAAFDRRRPIFATARPRGRHRATGGRRRTGGGRSRRPAPQALAEWQRREALRQVVPPPLKPGDRFVVEAGLQPEGGNFFMFDPGEGVTIGSAPGRQGHVSVEGIASQAAEVRSVRPGLWEILPTAGTVRLNGHRVDKPWILQDGDRIEIDGKKIKFETVEQTVPPPAPPAQAAPARPATPAPTPRPTSPVPFRTGGPRRMTADYDAIRGEIEPRSKYREAGGLEQYWQTVDDLTNWSEGQKDRLVYLVAGKGYGMSTGHVLEGLPEALDAMRSAGWTPDQQYQVIRLILERIPPAGPDIISSPTDFDGLGRFIYPLQRAGWNADQAFDLVMELTRKRPWDGVSYGRLVPLLHSMADLGWGIESQRQILLFMVEKLGPFYNQPRAGTVSDGPIEQLARGIHLRIFRRSDAEADEVLELLDHTVEKARDRPDEAVASLPELWEILNRTQWPFARKKEFIGAFVERSGHRHVRALALLKPLFEVQPSHADRAANLFLRLFDSLTDYNRDRTFELLEAHWRYDTLPHLPDFRALRQPHHTEGPALLAQLELVVTIFERWPRLGFPVTEGLLEAIKRKIVPEDPSAQSESILRFVGRTHGFVPNLFAAYAREGEPVLERVEQYARAIVADELSLEDVQRIVRENEAYGGSEFLLAVIQTASPTSGASFVRRSEQLGLLEKMLEAGDLRGHVPEAWRGRLREFELEQGEWQPRAGETVDHQGEVKGLLDAFRVGNGERVDDGKLAAALEEYLQSDRGDAARQKFRAVLFAYAGSQDALREKIDRIQDRDYAALTLLEQLFADKDNLPVVLRTAVERAPRELLAGKGRRRPLNGNIDRFVRAILQAWRNPRVTDPATRREILSHMLWSYEPGEVEARILSRADVQAAPGLADAIRAAMAGAPAPDLTAQEVVDEILEPPLAVVQREKARFEYQAKAPLRVGLRAVKGPTYGMNGLTSGVCTATDVELWKDPNFKLFAIIDRNSGQVVGYLHVFETMIEGRRYLTLPGINPSAEFLGTVDGEALFDRLMGSVVGFAQEGGYDGVYIPTDQIIHSNRSDIQKAIRRQNYPTQEIPEVRWNQLPKPYPFKKVFVVWERPSEIGARHHLSY